jgi:predicted phage-related endonuclease
MKRTGFIGGSDCVKIMQGDWLELWQIKTGRIDSPDLSKNLAVQMGIHTEDLNLKWFEQMYNCTLSCHQSEFENELGFVPAKGMIDAMWNDLSYSAIVEAKHTNSFNKMDDMLKKYMPQMQLYMRISGASECYLSVIFGNSKWESTVVSYDYSYFNSMWAVVSDFWDHVVRDKEPFDFSTPNVSTDSISVDNMVIRDASTSNEFVSTAATYTQGLEQDKVFQNAKKSLKEMVAPNEREVYCDFLTVRRDKRGALRITKRNGEVK